MRQRDWDKLQWELREAEKEIDRAKAVIREILYTARGVEDVTVACDHLREALFQAGEASYRVFGMPKGQRGKPPLYSYTNEKADVDA